MHASRVAREVFTVVNDSRLVRAHQAEALELVRQAEAAADRSRASAFRAIAAELEVRALELDAELAELAG
jgi:hypothetical protein